ncbi:hypothetical protein [Cysteiniphilum halobium]|uniref:hypothetical protein n=1 Tax=Cysteiniphilum halobium TaxID=2219059 RepID=UPI003F848F07
MSHNIELEKIKLLNDLVSFHEYVQSWYEDARQQLKQHIDKESFDAYCDNYITLGMIITPLESLIKEHSQGDDTILSRLKPNKGILER